MPIIRVNSIDMYYEIHGEGEAVVLIAGLNSDHTLYRGIFRTSRQDIRLLSSTIAVWGAPTSRIYPIQ